MRRIHIQRKKWFWLSRNLRETIRWSWKYIAVLYQCYWRSERDISFPCHLKDFWSCSITPVSLHLVFSYTKFKSPPHPSHTSFLLHLHACVQILITFPLNYLGLSKRLVCKYPLSHLKHGTSLCEILCWFLRMYLTMPTARWAVNGSICSFMPVKFVSWHSSPPSPLPKEIGIYQPTKPYHYLLLSTHLGRPFFSCHYL